MTKRELIIIGIAIIALCSAVYGWYHPRVEIRAGETITLPGKVVYRLKDCTVVPPAGGSIATGPTVTLATSDVPKCQEGGKLTTSLIMSTGEVHNQFTPKDRPFWSFENEKRIKLITNGTGGMLNAGWTFARIGNAHLSAESLGWSVSGQSGAYIGVGIEYRFFP